MTHTVKPSERFASNPYTGIFERQQKNLPLLRKRTTRERLHKLNQLARSLMSHRQQFRDALHRDFRKPDFETDITELYPVLREIRHTRSNLRNWMRPLPVQNDLVFAGTNSRICRIPKGNCLIISPWNYPVNLTLGPLVGAVAAGNAVVLKPSDLTPYTNEVIKKVTGEVFSEDEVCLVEGGRETAELLLNLPFNHICFTGSSGTGKEIMRAASGSLASLTLELGGKSPVYIHKDASLRDAAQKIAAGKLNNAGQSCVSPDYILVHQSRKEELVENLRQEFKLYYDPVAENNRFTGIIDRKKYERLENMTPGIEQPGNMREKLIFEPVIMPDARDSDAVMQEEIFGPVLPVIAVRDEDEALKIVNRHAIPLCIYVFTKSSVVKRLFTENSASGCLCINDCSIPYLHPGLPFGGIGESGMGRLHGKASFESFTNERVEFNQRIGLTTAKLLYPPYGKLKLKLIDFLLKYL